MKNFCMTIKTFLFSLLVAVVAISFNTMNTASAAYQKTADNTVAAYRDANLTQRTGNERVDRGDVVTVFQETDRAYYVRYPVSNGTKDRWVPKNIFNSSTGNAQNNNGSGDLNQIINSWTGKRWNGGGQCFGFANYVFEQLHGVKAGSYASNSPVLGSVNPGVQHIFLTYDAVIDKNAVDDAFRNRARPGDFITSSRPHSMIFVRYDSNARTVWVLDANWAKPQDNVVRYHSFTLDNFANAFRKFSIYTK